MELEEAKKILESNVSHTIDSSGKYITAIYHDDAMPAIELAISCIDEMIYGRESEKLLVGICDIEIGEVDFTRETETAAALSRLSSPFIPMISDDQIRALFSIAAKVIVMQKQKIDDTKNYSRNHAYIVKQWEDEVKKRDKIIRQLRDELKTLKGNNNALH